MTTSHPRPPPYRSILLHSIGAFLGQSLMQVVDLAFCRTLGSEASATVGTSTSFFAWFMILGLGVLSSLEYLIPHSKGARREARARDYFRAGFILIFVLSLISMLALILLTSNGHWFGMNPLLQKPVAEFSSILALSFLPTFLIPLLRIELQANGHPRATSQAFVLGNLLNLFLNWALVLGHAGFAPRGVEGAALANVISRFGILLYLVLHLKNKSNPEQEPFRSRPMLRIKTILRLGVPSSLHMLFEIGAFIFVGTLASRLSATESAAHAIAISLASFVFMIPAGMASAAAITMSRAKGAGALSEAQRIGTLTVKSGMLYALLASGIIFFTRSEIMKLYTEDPATRSIGEKLLMITAIFQWADALQCILAGCIRGFGETKVQAKMNFIGHWLIGVPAGLVLAFSFGWGVTGLWVGLSFGLFAVSLLLFKSYRYMF